MKKPMLPSRFRVLDNIGMFLCALCLPVLPTLRQLDVFCARSFLSLGFVESDILSFTKFLVAHAFDIGRVKKQILVAANVDKPKPFVSETLDRTFSHGQLSKIVFVGLPYTECIWSSQSGG